MKSSIFVWTEQYKSKNISRTLNIVSDMMFLKVETDLHIALCIINISLAGGTNGAIKFDINILCTTCQWVTDVYCVYHLYWYGNHDKCHIPRYMSHSTRLLHTRSKSDHNLNDKIPVMFCLSTYGTAYRTPWKKSSSITNPT